eukprot:TRINITY_DN15669_c0_g1_i3.p2 TRINITY_DN15669_c0_g1~~TRINITY_DN15669_c0_g1_i3.p2  ORF type:complete len:307 (-),score=76.45 TRINITY_DN15669_c0_g1_i3:205-1125(-)
MALVVSSHINSNWINAGLAPTVQLCGHSGPVFCVEFTNQGHLLSTASADKSVLLWGPAAATAAGALDDDSSSTATAASGCRCVGRLSGHHNGAVVHTAFSNDDAWLVSASADSTMNLWDVETGMSTRRIRGHSKVVNFCSTSRRGTFLIASASDDASVMIWDSRNKAPVAQLKQQFPMTCVALGDDTTKIYAAGIDPIIQVWDFRKVSEESSGIVDQFVGHTETVTCLRVTNDGSLLLSNAMDNSVRVWDVRPFVASETRFLKGFAGHMNNFEQNPLKCSMNSDNSFIASGSADKNVYIWDFETEE